MISSSLCQLKSRKTNWVDILIGSRAQQLGCFTCLLGYPLIKFFFYCHSCSFYSLFLWHAFNKRLIQLDNEIHVYTVETARKLVKWESTKRRGWKDKSFLTEVDLNDRFSVTKKLNSLSLWDGVINSGVSVDAGAVLYSAQWCLYSLIM